VVNDLRVGTDEILRAARKFELFVLQRIFGASSSTHSWESHLWQGPSPRNELRPIYFVLQELRIGAEKIFAAREEKNC
jgi:hypothetical protein